MKKEISTYQLWIVFIAFVGMIVWLFWHFSDPTKYNYRVICYTQKGWYINRRLGFDEYVGDIKLEKAREIAGENIIYYNAVEICN